MISVLTGGGKEGRVEAQTSLSPFAALFNAIAQPCHYEKNLVTPHEVVRLPCRSFPLASSSVTWPGPRMVVDMSNSSCRKFTLPLSRVGTSDQAHWIAWMIDCNHMPSVGNIDANFDIFPVSPGRISSGISRARVQGSSVCLLHWRGKK